MPKRMRVWNKGKYDRYIRDGRGQGEGRDYSPWVQVHDFASRGTISRIASNKTGRVHHFMSIHERQYFYLLEWSEDVLDIREQYPLQDVRLAVSLAGEAEIRYPRDITSGFPYVMTCDFMITTKQGLKARTIKQSTDLNTPRVLEKLEIERRYWQSIGIDWRVVTEHEIPERKVKNIEWLHAADVHSEEVKFWLNKDMLSELVTVYRQNDFTLYETATWIDNAYGLKSGTGLKILRCLLWTKQIPCTLDTDIKISLSNLQI